IAAHEQLLFCLYILMLLFVTVRPGICPPAIEIGCLEPQKDTCKMDANCPWPEKCCYQPCSLRCQREHIAPNPMRPGKCPIDLIKCLKKEQNVCKYDSQCLKPKKCCYNFCAYRCVNPA
uniref:WAP domain-containing protein n=1 Tax=Anolis carolinensis TaxID=28377 RepID=A0A803T905_ANOCA